MRAEAVDGAVLQVEGDDAAAAALAVRQEIDKRFQAEKLTIEEAASLICWTASEENSFTTGATFDLSGGRATY